MPRGPAPAYDTDLRTDPGRLRGLMAGASPTPFWLDRADRPAALPALAGDRSADLVVIGGGYCGLWTAVLAKRAAPDARVVLLEARRIGWAASGRNGGFVEPSLTHGPDNGARAFGGELGLLERLGRENLAAMMDDLVALGIDAGWERTGELTVATEPYQVAELRSAAPGAVLEGPALAAVTRSPLARAAVLDQDVAYVDPARLAWGLAAAARRLGVEVAERTPVRRLHRDGDGVVVVADGGAVRARRAVLATNGFPSLLLRNRLRTLPVYDYVLMTEPLTAAQLADIGWRGRYGIGDMGRQFHYSRRTVDDRVLWGGYDAVYHRGGRVRRAHDQRELTFLRLADHLVRTFPQLGDVRITHRWGGMIDMSSRLVAFHGLAMGGRVAYSSGFTGLGVAATRFAAAVMLDLLAGRRTDRTENRLVRGRTLPIPPEPFAFPAVQVVRRAVAAADRDGGRDGAVLRLADRFGYSFDS